MKILVTGSEGFIGKHVVRVAKERGHEITEFDYNRTPEDKYFGLNPKLVNEANAVIHLAALIDIKESFEKPWAYVNNNICGLEKLRNARRVVFASSAAVYGNFSPYGYAKRLGEALLPSNSVSLRLFNPFGPGEKHFPETHIVPLLIEAQKKQDPATLYKNGEQVRDFIFVEDVALAFVMAAESDFVGTLDLCDTPLTIREVADLIGATYILDEKDRDSGDTDRLVGNNTDIRFILGWKPQHNVRQELMNWRRW